MSLVDLSQPWSADTPAFPTDENPVVRWVKRLASHGTNHQKIETTLHVGTHIDAPLHWREGARDVASMPLDRLYGPAVIIDVSDVVGDYTIITPEIIESRAEIHDGDIVILHTGYHRYAFCGPDPDEIRYFFKHPGGYTELAHWIVARRLRWFGVDMASVDHAMNSNLSQMWPHLIGEAEQVLGQPLRDRFPVDKFQIMHTYLCAQDTPIVENLGGEIETLLGRRVTVCAFPWRFAGGEAAMVRVVAFSGSPPQ